MTDNIVYRELTDFNEYYHLEDIQVDSWGFPEREIVPKRIPYATYKSGGVVIGAFKDEQMIGYVWGWLGRNQEGTYIYSHHNAVRKEYQNKGIGFQLKIEQKKWAINNKFDLIKWVFDPLQTKNCHLNIHKLGGTSNTYKNNYWLELKDKLNEGIETDRLVCNWFLKSNHVNNHLNKQFKDYKSIIFGSDKQVLKTKMKDTFLDIEELNLEHDEPIIALEVPSNYIKMKKNDKKLAIDWRMKTRKAFQNYFEQGYAIIDFVLEKQENSIKCFHILKR